MKADGTVNTNKRRRPLATRSYRYNLSRRMLGVLLALFPSMITAATDGLLPSAYRTGRWLVRGIGSEMLTNMARRGGPPWHRTFRPGGVREVDGGAGAVAVVTGATGGIGSEVARGLSAMGYTVIVAARNVKRGEALVERLHRSGGLAEFVQYQAEDPKSAARLVATLHSRPCALLVNNAAVMGSSKSRILRVNLIAPAVLTMALLPSLQRHPAPRVVNVGSSSHLRAGRVDKGTLRIDASDRDLSAYAQSKLGLMQHSTLLRAALPWLTVVDAHPGLVWTPMLQMHWGKLAPTLEATRISRVLFKAPACAATTILTAALAPRVPPPHWGERSRWQRGWRTQPYFVNRRPGGFASRESRDMESAMLMWEEVIQPVAAEAAPRGYQQVREGLATHAQPHKAPRRG